MTHLKKCPFCKEEIILKQIEGMGTDMRWDWKMVHLVVGKCPIEIYIKTEGMSSDNYEAIEKIFNQASRH